MRPYVLSIFYGTIFTSLTRHAGLGVCSGVGGAGVVTVIQRFGSTINLKMHLHILLAGSGQARETLPRFSRWCASVEAELKRLLHVVQLRSVPSATLARL